MSSTATRTDDRTAYYTARFGAYRAAGEDHGDSVRWALDDTRARFDSPAGDRYDDGAADAEAAYERHLENRGADEADAQDAYEARNGVVGFIDAWHAESPDTCPCGRH